LASAIVSPLVLLTCGVSWLAYRQERWLVLPSSLAVVLLVAQALLGGVTVLTELPGPVVASHLALGQALLGCLVLVMVVAYRGPLGFSHKIAGVTDPAGVSGPDRFPTLALISTGAVYLLILSGSVVTASDATGACVTWPLCQGRVFPESLLPMIHMAHRMTAAVIGAFLLYVLYRGFQYRGFRDSKKHGELRLLSLAVAVFFGAQVLVGAFTIWSGFQPHLMALHLSTSALVWALLAGLAALSLTQPGGSPRPGESARSGGDTAHD
jgi:cytochrome c oxidase assembly protein subunit 15